MADFKKDMSRVQMRINEAFVASGGLVALADGGAQSPGKLQRNLEDTMAKLESATLELRGICEAHCPVPAALPGKPALPNMELTGSVELIEYGWLHLTLHTLLPHCRFQTPQYLSDTIVRLLDGYERKGHPLPHFTRALLVIDEHCDIGTRRVYDQDNKGWKAVSNAIKGRLIGDDDQFTLGVALVSTRSTENSCHIFLLDMEDASDFFAFYSGNLTYMGLY